MTHPVPTSTESASALDELRARYKPDATVADFTCHDCPLEPDCEFAWDLYNTEGDCLAEK